MHNGGDDMARQDNYQRIDEVLPEQPEQPEWVLQRQREQQEKWWQRLTGWWAKNKRPLVVVLLIAVLLILLYFLADAGYSYPWTGFEDYKPPENPDTGFQRGKTTWDWMQLLVVPAVLAIAAFFLNRTERINADKAAELRATTDRELAEQRSLDVVLDTYLNQMAELLIDKKLKSPQVDEVRDIARIRTLTALKRLDADRNNILIQFLHIAGLLREGEDKSGVPILKEAFLQGANLGGANLGGANLGGADLRGAILQGANLLETNLGGANLTGANLTGANLGGANLRGADLRGANLRGANLRATLRETKLEGAFLQGADLTRADLIRAYLKGANLNEAKLCQGRFTFDPDRRGKLTHPDE